MNFHGKYENYNGFLVQIIRYVYLPCREQNVSRCIRPETHENLNYKARAVESVPLVLFISTI